MKKQKNIFNILIIALCIFIVIGCKPKSNTVHPEQPAQESQVDENSDKFDLLDLSMDKKIIPLENPKHGAITGSGVLVDVVPIESDSMYQVVTDVPDEIDSLNSQSYRVQIFSSKNFGESRQEKIIAEEIFDRPVFLDYEVPYYKIRVGNFGNREKAEEYQQRVKASGYQNAWVVVVTVNVKETNPLYNDLPIPEILDSISPNNYEPGPNE